MQHIIQKRSENQVGGFPLFSMFSILTVKYTTFRKLLYIKAGVCERILNDVILLMICQFYAHTHNVYRSNLSMAITQQKVTQNLRVTVHKNSL
jgi:hypothetical protein